jgi:N,N'-diacetyllegionaminate synthase
MNNIHIEGSKTIGVNHPCFIIAEAGVNHNGNLRTAHDLIDSAASAGADAVKFQTWITELICARGAKKAEYQQQQCPEDADQFTMLKKLELPYEWHPELRDHAREKGLVFLSTPDEIQSARFLCKLGMPAIKIGSAELTNHHFLRQLADLGKPIILSTGMGTLDEIRNAVEIIKSTANVPLSLLHCLSAYPAPELEMNLRCIATLREVFKTPVGLSDHTQGSTAAIIAVGIGMNILEKHITLDHASAGPDHLASADPIEFSELVSHVRKAERMLGNGVKALSKSEVGIREAVRRTLLYVRDLDSEHILQLEDIEALRCGLPGISPENASSLANRRLARSVIAGTAVSESDFL